MGPALCVWLSFLAAGSCASRAPRGAWSCSAAKKDQPILAAPVPSPEHAGPGRSPQVCVSPGGEPATHGTLVSDVGPAGSPRLQDSRKYSSPGTGLQPVESDPQEPPGPEALDSDLPLAAQTVQEPLPSASATLRKHLAGMLKPQLRDFSLVWESRGREQCWRPAHRKARERGMARPRGTRKRVCFIDRVVCDSDDFIRGCVVSQTIGLFLRVSSHFTSGAHLGRFSSRCRGGWRR